MREIAFRTVARGLGRLAVVGTLAALVGACGSVREELGLTKQAPDEFSVVTKAPLILPPDYALRPPEPGAPRPQELQPQQQAQRALLRSGNVGGSGDRTAPAGTGTARQSIGETVLLQQAGAEGADPGIRRIVDEETSLLVEKDQSFTERLIFWQTQPPFGTVVDAKEEARRLRENAAIGKPVTEGETPTIERRKRAMFEGIF